MAWWQITLILVGSVITGILGGLLLHYLIKRFIKKPFVFARKHELTFAAQERRKFTEPAPPVKAKRIEATPAVENHRHKKEAVSMIPLLSRRSVIVLVIGLIIGVMFGLGYWALSPTIAEMGTPAQVSTIGQPDGGPYESIVDVRFNNRGITYMSVKELQRQGEYYAAKMDNLPFYRFLSQKVAEEAPQYSHSPEELAEMMRIRYNWSSDNPAIEVTVTGDDAQEVLFFTQNIAEAFEDYLVTEEQDVQSEQYQDGLKERDNIKAALAEAERELAALKLQGKVYDLSLDPDYIALSAKIVALEAEVAARASELATLLADGNTGHDYLDAQKAMSRASNALSEAKIELSNLEAQATLNDLEGSLAYLNASAKVQSLNAQLDDMNASLALLAAGNIEGARLLSFNNAGEPSLPTPIPPERIRGRNALMMGALVGIGGAWLVLNRKWLANGMPASPEAVPEDNEEDDA